MYPMPPLPLETFSLAQLLPLEALVLEEIRERAGRAGNDVVAQFPGWEFLASEPYLWGRPRRVAAPAPFFLIK